MDLGRYPIDRPDSAAYRQLIGDLRRELEHDGCAVLPGFVHEAGLERFLAEADAAAPKAHRSFNRTNVYFTKDDPSYGIGHPVRWFYDRSNAFVPADNFARSGPLRRIYEFDGFLPFLRDALDAPEERFFRYDDPLADVIINVVEEGQGFPWHSRRRGGVMRCMTASNRVLKICPADVCALRLISPISNASFTSLMRMGR